MKLLNKFRKRQDELAEIHINKARTGSALAIYKLFNRYFIKSFFGPFFVFLFPVIIYAILGSLMDYKLMFAGIVAMTGMSGLTMLPFSILELKKSILMKRIGASPVKTSKFTMVIISYFVFIFIAAVLWLMLWTLIIHQDPSMFNYLTRWSGFASFVYGIIINTAISISIGFFIATISSNENKAQAIGMLIMFPSQFLGGMFVTMDIISQSDVMNWISRFIPFRYSTYYLVSAQIDISSDLASHLNIATHVNPFAYADIHTAVPMKGPEIVDHIKNSLPVQDWAKIKGSIFKEITIYKDWESIVAIVYPYLLISAMVFISIKKFSWSAAR